MALAASLNPCCVLTASPVLGNATLADLAAFKKRGGEVYPFFFLPQATPSGISLVLSQETYFPTNWFQASNDSWESFEPLFSEVQEPSVAVPAEPAPEEAAPAEEEQPEEEEVETVFVEDEEEYEDYYIDDYEDDSVYYDDLDRELFEEAEQWERSHHLYNRKKDKVAVRSKQSEKKEKISKRFVNASRYAAELARRQALQEHFAEQQAAAREARAIAQAKAASLAPGTPASVRPRKAKPSQSNNRNNRVVADIGLTLAQITELQSRELTPEDYELLLILDASLPKKTLSKSLIDTFKTITLTSDSDDVCCVCMCSYAAGEVLKELPCGHRFHSGCIETWLSTASTNCPVDGLSLKQD